MEDEYELVCDLSNGTIANVLEQPQTNTPIFDAECH